MKYSRETWRRFYHDYVCFKMNEEIRSRMTNYQGVRTANWFLCYGYIDNELGFCFEVLACAREHMTDHLITVKEPNNDLRITLLAKEVEEMDGLFFNSARTKWHIKYKDKLEVIKECERNEAIEEIRKMEFLDPFRDPYMVDYVGVQLYDYEKDILEFNWAKFTGLGDHIFFGELITIPNPEFKLQIGNIIPMSLVKLERGDIVLSCDVRNVERLKKEDLEDGTLLDAYLHDYHLYPSDINIMKVTALLRDSDVIMPCQFVLGETDLNSLTNLVHEHVDDLDRLKGKTFVTNEQIRIEPLVVGSNGYHYIPVFSNKDAITAIDMESEFITLPFIDAIQIAKGVNQIPIAGIVVNPYTDSIVILEDIYESIENLTSIFEE